MEFYQPKELADALRLKAEYGAELTVINGGTDVVVAMNHHALKPGAFLDLSQVADFNRVDKRNGNWHLAAGATFAQMGRMPVACLAEASLSVGGPQIRNRGTIGGNLATASPAGDGSVALLAVDAEVELTHVERGSRWVALPDFFLDYRRTALQPDELITAVRFPADRKTAWYKIGKRGAVNISIVCCAIGRSDSGETRIAFGCVAPYPVRTPGAEALVCGKELTDEVIERTASKAEEEVAPIDDHRSPAKYRRAMCRTLTSRLLRQLRDAPPGAQTGRESHD